MQYYKNKLKYGFFGIKIRVDKILYPALLSNLPNSFNRFYGHLGIFTCPNESRFVYISEYFKSNNSFHKSTLFKTDFFIALVRKSSQKIRIQVSKGIKTPFYANPIIQYSV